MLLLVRQFGTADSGSQDSVDQEPMAGLRELLLRCAESLLR